MISLLREPLVRRTILPELHRRELWDGVWNLRLPVVYPRQPKNPARRARCEWDLRAFILEYFPHHVWDLNTFHEETIAVDQELVLLQSPYHLKDAEVAPRSIGKTTEKRIAVMWSVQCYRHGPFAVFFGATGPKAKENTDFIISEWRTNTALREDFPEIVDWLDSFHHDSRLVKYKVPWAEWSADALYLPWGGYVETYGMENSLQGTNVRGVRPWWLIFEDIEGLDVAQSEILSSGLERRVLMEAINMLDKNKPGIASFVGTIYTPQSFAAKITDRKKFPDWNGRRYSGIIKFPTREDLWSEYEAIVNGQIRDGIDLAGDADTRERLKIAEPDYNKLNENFRTALRYYVQRFDAMNEGAELLDKTRVLFSLHMLMYEKAINPQGFWCGIQNAPLDQKHQVITETKIEHLLLRCIGPEKRVVPEWGNVLFAGVDVGSDVRKGLHWCVDAFGPKGESCMIECGIETVLDVGSMMIDDEKVKIATLESALRQALLRLRDYLMQGFVKRSTGELLMPALIGIDARGTMKSYAWQPLIVAFCNRTEHARRWRPMLGQDWKQTMIAQAYKDGILNGQWYRQPDEKGSLYLRNTEYWLGQINEAHTLTAQDANGSVMPKARIFHKDCPRRFLHHLCNYEHHARQTDDVESKVKEGWHQKNAQPVDFADASAMARNLFDIWKWERRLVKPKPVTAQDSRGTGFDASMG